jgi:hypothetical protein
MMREKAPVHAINFSTFTWASPALYWCRFPPVFGMDFKLYLRIQPCFCILIQSHLILMLQMKRGSPKMIPVSLIAGDLER